MEKKIKFELSSFTLHILAMTFMLCDHLWATVVPGNVWLTYVGRIAFPMFAFLIVEGYFHTKSLKKYVGRLLLFAALSEIPFNLVMGGTWFYPIQQNVLWTFLIGILLIFLNEKAKKTGKWWVRLLTCIGTVFLGILLGLFGFVDYHYAGVLTVLVFYFFRGRKWWHFLAQFVLLLYINTEILKGVTYDISLFGTTVSLKCQVFAVLALLPIWLYRGKQGLYNKAIKYVYYAFYPVHLLILGLLQKFL